MLNIKDIFDTTVCTNNWCIPKFNNVFKTGDGYELEIGLYKEEDSSLTLQIFKGDDVILCESVKKSHE